MKRTVFSALSVGAIAASALAAGCVPVEEGASASSAASQGRQCFFTRSINGYSSAPDGPDGQERLYIDTGPNTNWLFETIGSCHDLDFAQAIALDTRGMTSVCTGNTETLLVPSPTGVQRCSVRLLQRMTDDEVDAAKAAAEAAEAAS